MTLTTFGLWIAMVHMAVLVLVRAYALCWKEQGPEGRVADAILVCVYAAAAYGLSGLLLS